jgi:hypothetical protein
MRCSQPVNPVDRLEAVAHRMYVALRASPCACSGTWGMKDGQPGQWILVKRCHRCNAMALYEAINPDVLLEVVA